MDTKISKENVLKLLKRKRDGTLNSSFKQLEINTGYSKGHKRSCFFDDFFRPGNQRKYQMDR